jgi:hypothetical protein
MELVYWLGKSKSNHRTSAEYSKSQVEDFFLKEVDYALRISEESNITYIF